MDQSPKRISKQFEEMEKQIGRMLRNMSLTRMMPFSASDWAPAADVYETDREIVVCMDISGIDPQRISVVVEPRSVTITGDRRFPPIENASCIHRLEIEHGPFKRTVSLPVHIDTESTHSIYKNGFLLIHLPKLVQREKITVQIG